MKTQGLQLLIKVSADQKNDLTGCIFVVSRTDDKAPDSGNYFKFQQRVNLKDPKVWKKLGEHFKKAPEPFDYSKVYPSRSEEDVKKILSIYGGAPQARGATQLGELDDDDVPF